MMVNKAVKKLSLRVLWDILKDSAKGFMDDRLMKMSAALSYYMIFSMGPLLLIMITLCGIFFGRDAVEGKVYAQLNGFVGHDTASQLQTIIQHAGISGKGALPTILGIGLLIVGASSVFAEMQESINIIWSVKSKPGSGLNSFLKNRLLSFSMIVSLAFLLLISLGISALINLLGNRLQLRFPGISVVIIYLINLFITITITTFIFAVVFKVLPDAKIRWRDVLIGAVATMILFLLGKFGISFYISKSNIGSAYGATGSLIVILVWVYYSAMILYFGAEFTKYYAVHVGDEIKPAEYAVTVEHIDQEKGRMSVQQIEKIKKDKQVP
jgi:membrane protein